MEKFNCLIVNAGSSSLKFRLYKTMELIDVASGICERIGIDGGFSINFNDKKYTEEAFFPDHDVATQYLINKLTKYKLIDSVKSLSVIASRIVHGGEIYKKSAILMDEDVEEIYKLGKFAPLHNYAAVTVIKALKKICSVPHVGVFDTSFHQSLPRINYEYAIPEKWRNELGIRRYGMHGTSFKFITQKMQTILKKDKVNLIICHLGNGASLCAVKGSKSYNTSMGLTPLAGLVMGTRSGDVDPSIFSYLERVEKLKAKEVETILNNKSGVKAFAGVSDMRDLEKKAKTDKEAKFAFAIWSKRIADYVAMYHNDLEGKVDALVFTAGIGENSPFCRAIILDRIKTLGFTYDKLKNQLRTGNPLKISNNQAKYDTYIVPTNEELMMAIDAKILLFKNEE